MNRKLDMQLENEIARLAKTHGTSCYEIQRTKEEIEKEGRETLDVKVLNSKYDRLLSSKKQKRETLNESKKIETDDQKLYLKYSEILAASMEADCALTGVVDETMEADDTLSEVLDETIEVDGALNESASMEMKQQTSTVDKEVAHLLENVKEVASSPFNNEDITTQGEDLLPKITTPSNRRIDDAAERKLNRITISRISKRLVHQSDRIISSNNTRQNIQPLNSTQENESLEPCEQKSKQGYPEIVNRSSRFSQLEHSTGKPSTRSFVSFSRNISTGNPTRIDARTQRSFDSSAFKIRNNQYRYYVRSVLAFDKKVMGKTNTSQSKVGGVELMQVTPNSRYRDSIRVMGTTFF